MTQYISTTPTCSCYSDLFFRTANKQPLYLYVYHLPCLCSYSSRNSGQLYFFLPAYSPGHYPVLVNETHQNSEHTPYSYILNLVKLNLATLWLTIKYVDFHEQAIFFFFSMANCLARYKLCLTTAHSKGM